VLVPTYQTSGLHNPKDHILFLQIGEEYLMCIFLCDYIRIGSLDSMVGVVAGHRLGD
jgi:hypothetical protein